MSFFRGQKDEKEAGNITNQSKIIPSAQHWDNMQKRFDKFEEQKMETDDEKDETCYQELKAAIIFGIKCGKESEGKDLDELKKLSHQASEKNIEVFSKYGNDKIPTPIGPKTLAFIKCIYEPYYIDSQHLVICLPVAENASFFEKVKQTAKQTAFDTFFYFKKGEYATKLQMVIDATDAYCKANPEQAKKAEGVISKALAVAPILKIDDSQASVSSKP